MMKNYIIFTILLFANTSLFSQIEFTNRGRVFPDSDLFVALLLEPEDPNIKLSDDIELIKKAFREMEIDAIKEYLSLPLQDMVFSMDSLFGIHEIDFQGLDSVYLYEHSSGLISENGTIGKTLFTHKNGSSFNIEYTYKKKPKLQITQIVIAGVSFPSERILKLKKFKEEYEYLKVQLEILKPDVGNPKDYLVVSKSKLSSLNGSFAWYALFQNENKEAINAALKALDLDPSNKWIYTNLALGYA